MKDYHDSLRHRFFGYFCVYYGDVSTTKDHYPPKSVTNFGVLLPCCAECNSGLGARFPYSFASRCEIAKTLIRSKYRKVLMMPDWSDDELEEVSYTIRKQVEAWQEQRTWVNERLAWNVEEYLKQLDQENDFARIIAECDLIMGNVRRRFDRSAKNSLEDAKEERSETFKV